MGVSLQLQPGKTGLFDGTDQRRRARVRDDPRNWPAVRGVLAPGLTSESCFLSCSGGPHVSATSQLTHVNSLANRGFLGNCLVIGREVVSVAVATAGVAATGNEKACRVADVRVSVLGQKGLCGVVLTSPVNQHGNQYPKPGVSIEVT